MEKALILDSNSILYRSFHALPPLTTKKGQPTGAIYGFLLVLFRAIREVTPDFIFACFDFPAKTFRHQIFKEYKIQRPPIPKDLASQIPKLKEILNALSIPIFEKEGFEADDLIGTICEKIKDKEKIILTGDYDTLQLVDERTKIWVLKTKARETLFFDLAKVKERYGILPEQIVDLKSLIGDPSDNVPKISQISEKIAQKLIKKFGNLENLYKKIKEKPEDFKEFSDKILKVLIENKDKIFLNRELVKIRRDLQIDFDLREFKFKNFNRQKLISIFKELEFQSLIERLPEIEKTLFQKAKVKENLRLW